MQKYLALIFYPKILKIYMKYSAYDLKKIWRSALTFNL